MLLLNLKLSSAFNPFVHLHCLMSIQKEYVTLFGKKRKKEFDINRLFSLVKTVDVVEVSRYF